MGEITWIYQGNTYKVGEALNEYPWEDNNIFPMVFYKGKLYNAYIKYARKDKVCLKDIYYSNKKPYWTTTDKVFNIIKDENTR